MSNSWQYIVFFRKKIEGWVAFEVLFLFVALIFCNFACGLVASNCKPSTVNKVKKISKSKKSKGPFFGFATDLKCAKKYKTSLNQLVHKSEIHIC